MGLPFKIYLKTSPVHHRGVDFKCRSRRHQRPLPELNRFQAALKQLQAILLFPRPQYPGRHQSPGNTGDNPVYNRLPGIPPLHGCPVQQGFQQKSINHLQPQARKSIKPKR